MKKLFTVILLVVFLTALCAFSTDAATYGGNDGAIEWSFDTSTGALTISGTGAMPNYQDTDKYYGRTPWRDYILNIKTITINSGVTRIGDWAFAHCHSLSKVTIPSTVTSIGEGAFKCCCESLTSIAIPNSVKSIGEEAFSFCSALKSLTIPDSVTTVGSSAIWFCQSLKTLTIGTGMTALEGLAPSSCYSLTTIKVSANSSYLYSDEYGVLYNKNKTTLLCYPMGNTRTSYTIPSTVTSIGASAFFDSVTLESVTIPKSVKSIGPYAFNSSSVTNVYYLGTVANWLGIEIMKDAFYNCRYNLYFNGELVEDVVVPNTVSGIGDYAFNYCNSLKTIDISNNVSAIGNSAFRGCKSLNTVTYGKTLRTIGDQAFEGCSSLNSVILESGVSIYNDNVSSIGNAAFSNCGALKNVSFGAILQGIGNYAFYGCDSLTSINGYNFSAAVGDSAFYGCKALTTFGQDISSVGTYAFSGCENLTSVSFASWATSIGDYAFKGCCQLSSIYIPSKVTNIGLGAFIDCSNLSKIQVATGNQYYSDVGGILFDKGITKLIQYPTRNEKDTYSIPLTVTQIDPYAFCGHSTLTEVTISSSVTNIGDSAFLRCKNLVKQIFILKMQHLGLAYLPPFMRILLFMVIPAVLLKHMPQNRAIRLWCLENSRRRATAVKTGIT